ncbi:hypothetical protein MHYP_G00055140 [Metynnis hypsauchen]
MKSNRCPKRAPQSASPSSSSSASLNYRSSARTSASSSALSPVHSASLALFALLLLSAAPLCTGEPPAFSSLTSRPSSPSSLSAAPLCTGTPVFLNPSTVQHEQLLNLIDNACSSYLSAEQPLRTSDVLRDFCGLMLGVLRKSQELAAREPSKRFLFHYTKANGAGLSDGTQLLYLNCLALDSSYPSSIAEDAEEWSHMRKCRAQVPSRVEDTSYIGREMEDGQQNMCKKERENSPCPVELLFKPSEKPDNPGHHTHSSGAPANCLSMVYSDVECT